MMLVEAGKRRIVRHLEDLSTWMERIEEDYDLTKMNDPEDEAFTEEWYFLKRQARAVRRALGESVWD